MGVPFLPPANGWVWVKGGQKYIMKDEIMLPPFFSEKLQKPKIFPPFFWFRVPVFFWKRKGKFSGFGTEIFEENFRAETGRRLNRILEKSSSLVVNSHQSQKDSFLKSLFEIGGLMAGFELKGVGEKYFPRSGWLRSKATKTRGRKPYWERTKWTTWESSPAHQFQFSGRSKIW